jgi:hypothetical protein|tara:strand:- start:276 stop:437 length:162 start_codon:yes stop_codon:yes gene_type:complete
MIKKEKFDGRSRPTNKVYEESWNRIFGKKKKPLNKKDKDLTKELKKIEERNGF